jgi:outer membrane lipoprotein-sorting protein
VGEELAMRRSSAVLVQLAAFAMALCSAKTQEPFAIPQEDAQARAAYDAMIQALRAAPTLRYESEYRWSGKDGELGHCRYVAELAKPNWFRLTATSVEGGRGGTLVGDGRTLWTFWHGARPFFSTEDPKTYRDARDHQYMKKPAPPGRHSIGHETTMLGAGMSMTILDPSTFHGYTDSLQRYLDGVQSKGTLTPGEGEERCDVLLVSFMKGQRTWELCVSQRDHLPRKLREVIRVQHEIVVEETWSKVEVGVDLPAERFRWEPPSGWTQWTPPRPEDRLLKAGAEAPDFELLLADGRKQALSALRGQAVWLVFWRVG